MRLRLITPVPAVTASADDDTRTINGLALPYGQVGRTSAGPVFVRAGAVQLPTDLRRVILFREHGRRHPVGHAVDASETSAGLSMSFRAARTPDGDLALVEAAEHVRDALSVELDDVEMTGDGRVVSATLTAVALTSIPAFTDARIVASASDPDTVSTDPDDAGDDADDTDEGDSTVDPDNDTDTPADAPATTPAATAPAPTRQDAPPAGTVTAARAPGLGRRTGRPGRRGLSLDAAMRHVVTMVGESPDVNRINAALSDITPAADTSDGAFIRPQWVDELWTPVDTRRPYANSVTPGILTGMTVHGWKWGTKPVVGPYAGNKAAIPSGPVTFGPASANAERHAGGWDVDNIFVYLGDSSLLTAILNAAAFDYGMKQEASISTAIQAEATPATATDVVDGLSVIANTLSGSGARPSFIGLAADLWGAFTGMTTQEAPWWLSPAATSVNLTEGTSAAADLRVFLDPALPAQHMVGGDRRAVTFYEPRGNPFRVQAVNIPNGGIDIGIFGFSAVLVNDDRGLVDVTVGTVVP